MDNFQNMEALQRILSLSQTLPSGLANFLNTNSLPNSPITIPRLSDLQRQPISNIFPSSIPTNPSIIEASNRVYALQHSSCPSRGFSIDINPINGQLFCTCQLALLQELQQQQQEEREHSNSISQQKINTNSTDSKSSSNFPTKNLFGSSPRERIVPSSSSGNTTPITPPFSMSSETTLSSGGLKNNNNSASSISTTNHLVEETSPIRNGKGGVHLTSMINGDSSPDAINGHHPAPSSNIPTSSIDGSNNADHVTGKEDFPIPPAAFAAYMAIFQRMHNKNQQQNSQQPNGTTSPPANFDPNAMMAAALTHFSSSMNPSASLSPTTPAGNYNSSSNPPNITPPIPNSTGFSAPPIISPNNPLYNGYNDQLNHALALSSSNPYAVMSSMYNGQIPNHPPGYDIGGFARRKNATRESTSTLKAWLYEHRKNPYPTKGEKIMLAIVTRMTLTQVSTWFANARRRLKKENKMTWSPRGHNDEEDDDDEIGDGRSGRITDDDGNQLDNDDNFDNVFDEHNENATNVVLPNQTNSDQESLNPTESWVSDLISRSAKRSRSPDNDSPANNSNNNDNTINEPSFKRSRSDKSPTTSTRKIWSLVETATKTEKPVISTEEETRSQNISSSSNDDSDSLSPPTAKYPVASPPRGVINFFNSIPSPQQQPHFSKSNSHKSINEMKSL